MAVFCQTIRSFVSTRSLDTVFVYGLIAIVFIKAVPVFRFRISKVEFSVIITYCLIWIGSIAATTEFGSIMWETITDIIRTCLLVWLAARIVHMSQKLIIYLRLAAYIILLRAVLDLFVFSTGQKAFYSQYAGYQLFFGFSMLLVPMLIDKKWYDFAAGIICLLFTLFTGARGPFVFCIITFIICLLNVVGEKKKLFRVIPLILIITVLIALNLQRIMRLILRFMSIRGGSTRTIQTIIEGNIFSYTSGRENVYPIALEYIKNHLLIGSGFINDRVYISRQLGLLSEITGSYAHNIFLEIGMQFGIILGSVIIVFLFRLFYQTYKQQSSSEEKLFYTALLCAAILPLLVSGSYLTFSMFYALLGYSFTDRQRRNRWRYLEDTI